MIGPTWTTRNVPPHTADNSAKGHTAIFDRGRWHLNYERHVSHKINSEVVVLLGWGPAILLQFAHPLVAAGVSDHSSFGAGPSQRVRRFRQTLRAMLALTFGAQDEARQAARGINAIHDRVYGELREPLGPFPKGTRYTAHDPELLRWVHATMLHMLPLTYELYVGPLRPDEKDRYCVEASGIAPLLGIPDNYLPTSMVELDEYMQRMLASDQIQVTSTARALANEILCPEYLRAAVPLRWLLQLPTIGLLPAQIRKQYGFSWGPRHTALLSLSTNLVRHMLPFTPPILRYWAAARSATHVDSSSRANNLIQLIRTLRPAYRCRLALSASSRPNGGGAEC